MRTAFISGHLDLTPEEFYNYYTPLIMEAIERGDDFIVCDAAGTDCMAQNYLRNIKEDDEPYLPFPGIRVTVYHMLESPRNNPGRWPTKGGFASDKERDAAATAASDYDIAWVRPGREKSGTAKNIARRKTRSCNQDSLLD